MLQDNFWGKCTSLHKNAMTTKCKVWAYELSRDIVLRDNVMDPACNCYGNGVKQLRNRVITAMACQSLISRSTLLSHKYLRKIHKADKA